MKVLAISDVAKWDRARKAVKLHAPNVVTLIGDLASDPSAIFAGNYSPKKQRKDFIEFLEYAGQLATVLVVAGNHDDSSAYDVCKINQIPGCSEISGKAITLNGIRFLGVGYQQAHFLRLLRPIVCKYKGEIDIVLSHCEGRRLRELASISPRLIIQGHFGVGQYSVYGVPTVFIAEANSALITLPYKRPDSIPVLIDYRTRHHPIRLFVRDPSLVPYGSQQEHENRCEDCAPKNQLFYLRTFQEHVNLQRKLQSKSP